MKITYDPFADAAYIHIANKDDATAVTYVCEDLPESVQGDINLDFDKSGKLIGIEILQASKSLPQELLKHSQTE